MFNDLIKVCSANIDSFKCLGDTLDTSDGPLIYIDNDADILGVGHLDSVGFSKPYLNGNFIRCRQLDDRLGVWALLHLSKQFRFDILLTDSEEKGTSTAGYFEPQKDYNWVFEFDRAGNDCVLYDYEDQDTIDLISSYGWQVGVGAFSDICWLEHLKCKAFNFGIGYYNQHTKKCYANLNHTKENLEKFTLFYQDMKNTLLVHDGCKCCGVAINASWNYCPYCGWDVNEQVGTGKNSWENYSETWR